MLQFQHVSASPFSVRRTLTLQTHPVMGKHDPSINFLVFLKIIFYSPDQFVLKINRPKA
jgi:hypothetical protein